jgi:hypothetical protein
MATIPDFVSNFKRLNNNKFNEIVVDEMFNYQERIIDLNKDQLMSGFDSTSQRLRSYKNREYAEMKNEVNPLAGFGNPDLKLTGQFHRGFHVRRGGKTFLLLNSRDEKNDMLKGKYGKDIFGLTSSSKEEFIEGGYQDRLVRALKRFLNI